MENTSTRDPVTAPGIDDKTTEALRSLPGDLRVLLTGMPFWIAVIIFVAGGQVNEISSSYLGANYGSSLPRLNDLLLDRVPYYPMARFYDVLVIIPQALLLLWVVMKRRLPFVPYILTLFGIWQFLRAAFIILTPLGDPNPNGVSPTGLFDSAPYHFGFYPSGHTSNTMFACLFTGGIVARTNVLILLIMIVALIIGHAHYSIDIFSGILFTYAIVKFGERYLASYFVLGNLKF